MPSKNFAVTPGWSQADQRGYAVFYDQHKCAKFPQGRPWWAVVERPAEGAAMPMPVGELQPQGWDAPWMPDATYINASVGRATPGATMQEHRFRIDYGAMIADRRRAMREYYDRAILEAIAQGWQAPDYGDPIPYRLRAIVGPMPLSPKIPEAALAEDPWILGFTPVENEQLARLLKQNDESIITAVQSEKRVDRVGELEQKLAAAAEQMNELIQRDKEREAALKQKMAKARAGKKKPQTAASG